MTYDQNQFALAPVKGQVDMHRPGGSVSCIVDASSGTLVAGQAVIIVDSTDKIPHIKGVAATTDNVLGFVGFEQKDASFVAGDRVEISLDGEIMYMEAGAAFAKLTELMVVVAGSKVVTATQNNRVIGWAFDKASADLDLVRVFIKTPSYKLVP